MNPWTDSFEQYRQDILGEDKKKSDKQTKQRWQDDDGDEKWYEKSDVDGKISDREKKEKEKNSKKEVKEEGIADILGRLEKKRISKGGDPEDSPLPAMRKYHADKKKKKVKKGDWIGPPPKKKTDPYKKHVKSEEVVQEADSLAGQVSRWEAARQKRMKQRQSYERPHWIPRDQDHEDNWGSSKGEKKKKVKEDITLTRGDYGSRNVAGSAWHTAAKRGFKGYKAGGGLTPQFKLADDVQIDHIDGSTTQIIDVVRAPAMVAAPKFSNWKEDMQWEALKGEKLDIDAEKGKVKNHVDINPTIKTEEKKNLNEGGKVTYYGGQDRDKKTGLPKGLKSSPMRTEKEVNKKLDYSTLAQSYEPEGDMLVDEGLGDLINTGITKTFNAADKVSAAMDKNRVGRFVKGAAKKVFGPWKSTDGGTNRKSATFDTHGPAHKGGGLLNQSYDSEGELVEGDYHSGQGEKKQKRTLQWMKDRAKPGEDVGAPGLNAYKERQKEHEDKRGKKKVSEARVDQGRSDYGKATIRNYRRFGPGHGEPAMFDPENKRGKAIEKRREEGKERRGKKKAKVPAYKVEHHKKPGEEHPIDEAIGLGTVGAIAGSVALAGMGLNAINKLRQNKKTMDTGGKFKAGSTMDNIQKKNNMLKQLQNQSYEPEGEVLEATKYSKVKGKNYKSGKKSVKGGTAKDDAVYKSVLANIIKQVGAGGVQQSSKQGKKKKGEKGRKQIGDRKFSPAETIRRKKASAKAAYDAMTDTRGT